MRKFVAAFLVATLLFLSNVTAQAQQFQFLPAGTTVNAVPYDATTGASATVIPQAVPTLIVPYGYKAAGTTLYDGATVVGSDSCVYFPVTKTGFGTYGIAKVSTAGVTTVYDLPTANAVGQLTLGSDGNVWGTYFGTGKIFSIDTSGAITEYTLGVYALYGIVFNSSDGLLYASDATGHTVLQVSLAGAVLATSGATGVLNTSKLCVGPDGRVWGGYASGVFAVDSSCTLTGYAIGKVVSLFSYGTSLYAMDGQLGYIYKLDTSGTVLAKVPYLLATSSPSVTPYGGFAVLAGKLIVSEGSTNQLVYLDPANFAQRTFNTSNELSHLTGLVVGADGLLYAVSPDTQYLYRFAFGGLLSTVNVDTVSNAVPLLTAFASSGSSGVLKMSGASTAILSITGTFSATVNFEASFDQTNWVSISGNQVGTSTIATSATTASDWVIPTGGYAYIRPRVSGYASGSVTVNGYSSTSNAVPLIAASSTQAVNVTQVLGSAVSASNPLPSQLSQGNAALSATNPLPSTLEIAGAVNSATNGIYSNLLFGNAVLSQTNGLPTEAVPSKKATYAFITTPFTPAATATDMLTVTGSGTKTVKIQKIVAYMTAATSVFKQFYLIRRSSANSGGTPTAVSAAKLDTNDAAATSTVNFYTANPASLGTSVANIDAPTLVPALISSGAGVGQAVFTLFDAKLIGEPITLRGTSDILAINFNSQVQPTTPSYSFFVYLTEE